MPSTGEALLKLARRHVGEKYILGSLAPKNNPNWTGPWDCAEFASWLVFQSAGILYGCEDDQGDPASANAYTGFWGRDANSKGTRIALDQAARTPGAAVLRVPQAGATGHIVISDGLGGTVEAHSSKRGVIAHKLAARRWDTGILVPGITYSQLAPVVVPQPSKPVYRLTDPHMQGPKVKEIQKALKAAGFNPGPLDGDFGAMTQAAVVSFQVTRGLVPDGEVGPKTAKALAVQL